jgi:hypothetical protein
MVHFESEVFANQAIHSYWSKVKDTVKSFTTAVRTTGLFCFFRIQDLLVVMLSFLILPTQLFSKGMNISN